MTSPNSRRSVSEAVRRERTERVLDVLEDAVTAEPDVDLPVAAPGGLNTLPESLRDPMAVLERGRRLLRDGLPVQSYGLDAEFDNQLRAAARNGKRIPAGVRRRMSDDRAASEQTSPGDHSEPGCELASPAKTNNQSKGSAASNDPFFVGRETEIEELTTLLVSQFATSEQIDVEQLAAAEGLTYSFGHYQEYFDGLLECRSRAFHIYINLDTNKGRNSPRARFSFAHELGHYFLDWHRAALIRGIPSHGSRVDFDNGDLAVEREADMFAACLLLPASRIKKAARPHIDAEEIKRLANHFCTSISATALRCARLELAPLIAMRWTSSGRSWCWSSTSFFRRVGNKPVRLLDSLPTDSPTRMMLTKQDREFHTCRGTTLATWFPAVHPGSSWDDVLVEECISLGVHGVLTILRPALR
jgi:Zn-dependent peptidase ImmA (M78 family)